MSRNTLERIQAAIAKAMYDASRGVPKELIGDRFVVLGNQKHDCQIYAEAVMKQDIRWTS